MARGYRRRSHMGRSSAAEGPTIAGRAQSDDADNAAHVVGGQHHAGRFDGDVGADSDSQPDVGAGQGQGVVDAIANLLQSREGSTRLAALGPGPYEDARLHLTFTSRTHRDHTFVL
jgi:hypothetical protein